MSRVKRRLAQSLFRIARSNLGEVVVGWSFAYMTDFMPANKILETETVLAFHHPVPTHEVHILIVPKRKVRSLLEMKDGQMLHEIVKAAQHLVEELQLEKRGYSLTVNGGQYQDVRQLHFHLVSDG
jgi:histidine triad (HIT) family protein